MTKFKYETTEGESFDNAKEFLEALRLTNPRWQSDKGEPCWIFRGQNSAEWELIPSSFRLDSDPFSKSRIKTREEIQEKYDEWVQSQAARSDYSVILKCNIDLVSQIIHEIRTVRDFASLANDLGYPIPQYEILEKWVNKENRYIEELLLANIPKHPHVDNSLFALAQHHGIPTRLLDWTEKPLIAAFFATLGIKDDSQGSISVWALNKAVLPFTSLKLVTIPKHHSDYLHAQKGLFVYDSEANNFFYHNGRFPQLHESMTFEEVQTKEGKQLVPKQGLTVFNDSNIQKLTLVNSEVGRLLHLLWLEDIYLANLMPTYDNIVKTLITKSQVGF